MANKWHTDENLSPEEIIRQIDMEFGDLDNIPARIAREAALEQAQANKKTTAFERSMANSGGNAGKPAAKSNAISIEEMRRKYKKNYAETYGSDDKNKVSETKVAPKEECSAKSSEKEAENSSKSIEDLEKSIQDAIKEDDFNNEENVENVKKDEFGHFGEFKDFEEFDDDAEFLKDVAAAEYMTPLTEEEKEVERQKTMRSWQLISGFAISFACRIFLVGFVFGGWLDKNYFGGKGYASMFMILISIFFSFYYLYRDCMKINAK